MKYRELGQGLKVSAIGVGCMPMIKGGNMQTPMKRLRPSTARLIWD
jgi:aryl-alcohol dehydrogenase-like predicted oxidoreductase